MAQVIKHDSRRDKRRDWPPLSVRIDGLVHMTRDWSLGGLAVVLAKQRFVPGDVVSGDIAVGQPPQNWCPFVAEVVRADYHTCLVALRFAELSSNAFDLLERHMRRPAPGRGV